MKAHLRLQLPPLQRLRGEAWVDWAWLERGQVVAHGHDPLVVLGARHPDAPVLAGLDAQDLILLELQLPPLPARRLPAALQGEVEALLLDDLHDVVLGHGPQGADGVVPVAWLGVAALEQLVTALAACQLRLHALYPTPLLLPWQEGVATVQASGDHVVVRSGRDRGFVLWRAATGPGERWEALSARLRAVGMETVQWLDAVPADWPVVLRAQAVSPAAQWTGPLPGWSLPLPAARRRFPRLALGLAAAALLLLALGLQVQALQWRSQGQALQRDLQAQLRAGFPGIGEIVDPVQQARRALATPVAPAALPEVQQLVAATLQAVPELGGQVRGLRYQPGEVELELDSAVHPLLEDEQRMGQWQQALQAHGLRLAMAHAGTVRVHGGAPP
ncbi:type II secretion system protein GspL [Stenotrophomonas sp. 24(2023)]|uniref:type II secretion system protein GspL n=1 Tax=Stenotrophomonas sp. 24(2023) TaxID=3068324 RepID=UPI0027DFE5CB|nr:type II secretion system protein GspL [Stenotrophomonas sp. 24(2023)]WMJ69402.1 type II secretion system protein GspL [Stenotrophomonas sp. 24(2023)]